MQGLSLNQHQHQGWQLSSSTHLTKSYCGQGEQQRGNPLSKQRRERGVVPWQGCCCRCQQPSPCPGYTACSPCTATCCGSQNMHRQCSAAAHPRVHLARVHLITEAGGIGLDGEAAAGVLALWHHLVLPRNGEREKKRGWRSLQAGCCSSLAGPQPSLCTAHGTMPAPLRHAADAGMQQGHARRPAGGSP